MDDTEKQIQDGEKIIDGKNIFSREITLLNLIFNSITYMFKLLTKIKYG